MEAGELTLEESLRCYERGVELSRACQKSLDAAEQRIRILSEKDGEAEGDDRQAENTQNTAHQLRHSVPRSKSAGK